MSFQPPDGYRYYSKGANFNQVAPALNYLLDTGVLWQDVNGNQYTGAFRPTLNTDLASTSNVSISGLNLTVGSVTLTGTNPVTISNAILATSGAIQGGNSLPIYVTGLINTVVTGTVSSNVTIGSVGVTGFNSGSALGNIPVNNVYLPVSGVNFNTSVSVNAVAITGFNSGSALGFLDVTHTYLPISGVNNLNVVAVGGYVGLTGAPVVTITGILATTATVTVGAVAITGFNSGSALANLDLSRTYLPVSGVGTFLTSVSNTVTTNATLVGGSANIVNSGGYLAVTGAISGNGLGNLDLTRTFLPVSGAGGGFISITTGTLTATIAAGTSVAVTGGSINVIDNLGWQLLSGISGALTSNLSGSAPITGDIRNIPGTVLAISGTVLTIVTGTVSSTISNPIGVSGVAIDKALPSVGGFATQFLPMGGRVMNASGAGSITGFNSTGDLSMLTISKDNGGLFVNQGVLDQTQDNVTVWTASTGVGPLTSLSGAAPIFFGTALPNNPYRRAWFATNLATGGLMIKMSSTIPTTGNLDIFLKGATTPWAGDGASWIDQPAVYTGPVSVSGFGGAPCVYRMWEL